MWNLMDSIDLIIGGLVIVSVLLTIYSKSYIVWGILGLVLLGFNENYGAGAFTYVLTIIFLLIILRFVRKRKLYAREQKLAYRDGRETAKWSKKFNEGYDEEYYR